MRGPGIAAAAVAVLLLAACSRVTPENYERIEAGMDREEVYRILGKPDEVSGSGLGALTLSSEDWQGSGHRIHVNFAGDRVATKSIEPNKPAE